LIVCCILFIITNAFLIYGAINKQGGGFMKSSANEIVIRPGEIVPDSGIYEDTTTGLRATLVKGEHAPPTSSQGSAWRQVIDTNPNN
jgi:hypothetical protein